jgi:hypothetical protein
MLGLRVAHADSRFVLATWRTLLIVVFRGPIEPRQFVIIEPVAHALVRDAREGGGLLTVFEAGAFEADERTRATAARIFEDAGRVLRAIAIVYEGGARGALAARSKDILARSETSAKVASFPDVSSAAAWLVPASETARHADDVRELVEEIERVRAHVAIAS